MEYIGRSVGPRGAELAIVAQKYGRTEHELLIDNRKKGIDHHEPLVGKSGYYVNQHLLAVGTSRTSTYLTNAVKRYTDYESTPTRDELIREQASLYRELATMPNLKCIVAMGAHALASLTNFHTTEIDKWRGSVLTTPWGCKVVPTFHPSFYMRGEWRYKPVVEFDIKRAFEQSKFPEIRRPVRDYFVAPTFTEACSLLETQMGQEWISFDIETFRPAWVSCIAFANDPSFAFSIPIMNGRRQPYYSVAEEAHIWRLICRVLAQKGTRYVTQNGLFDCRHLYRHGVETPFMGTGFDTMYAHSQLAPGLPHDLGFLVSIYTDEPYYKDESGTTEDWTPHVPDEQFWTYNCKDAACTLEVAWELIKDMKEVGMYDTYMMENQAQWPVVNTMERRGIKCDVPLIQQTRLDISASIAEKNALLQQEVGWIPNTKSYLDMGRFFDQIKVPYDVTPTGRPKSDKEAMPTYAARALQAGNLKGYNVIRTCMSITKERTLESNFLTMVWDPWDFYHPSYLIGKTVTNRNASEGNWEGGPQLHNIPMRMRRLFIASGPDREFTQLDLKQAENILQTFHSRDPLMIQAFKENRDSHRIQACILYRNWNPRDGMPPDSLMASIRKVCDDCEKRGETDCNHGERPMAKTNRYAYIYGMGPVKHQRTQREKDIFITLDEARRVRQLIVNEYIQAHTNKIKNSLRQSPWLETPLGAKREFYGIADDDMIREACSWLNQRTVAQVKNKAIMYLYEHLPETAYMPTETHDSVLIDHEKKDRPLIMQLAQEAFDTPITINGETFTIPVEAKHGPNWADLQEERP